jgi:hypothetical protein
MEFTILTTFQTTEALHARGGQEIDLGGVRMAHTERAHEKRQGTTVHDFMPSFQIWQLK